MDSHTSTLGPSVIGALRSRLRGATILPGDQGYAVARQLWNAAIDQHPPAIVACADAEDVALALRIAAGQRGPTAIQRGPTAGPVRSARWPVR